jgi:hypothetical protein
MRKSFCFLTILVFIIFIKDTLGDRRYFGRSYLAYTLPAGAFEFELWNTGRIGKYQGYFYRFQPRFEFEYGITDRLSASLYFNFDQITAEDNAFSSKSFGFSSNSLELRYRLTDPGQLLIDPALYFEFAYGGDEIEYESKAIFSKRFGNFLAVINSTSEIEREITGTNNKSAFEITAGAMYEINSNFALGIEFRNHWIYTGIYKKEESKAAFLGPTINFQTQSFYLTFNFIAQAAGSPETRNNLDLVYHEKFEFRTILGIEL